MTSRDEQSNPGNELRRQAEEIAREKPALSLEDIQAMSAEEIQRVFHKMQVHQIELEVQNDDLRTAQALTEAGRARYFDLYDLAPVGYCTLSELGFVLEANLTAATLLGLPRSELVTQPLSRFIHNDDQHIYSLHRKQLLETATLQKCDLRLVKPDGGHIWAHMKGTVTRAEDGAPVSRVVLSDISGRKRAEEALIESEALFRGMFKDHSAVMLLIDPTTGQIVKANHAAAQYYGYPLQTMIQMNIQQLNVLSPAEIAEKMAGALNRQVNIFEFRHVLADGQVREVQVHSTPITIQNQILLFSIIHDITERRRAEEAVSQLAENGVILLNTIQTQIWYLTDDHTYGAVNKAHAEFNGLKIEDMAFRNMYDFFPEDVVEVCRQGNIEVFTTGKPVRSEEWVPHVSGEPRLISILKSPRLRAEGTVEYVVCAAEDITERKRAEEALQERERYQRALLDNFPFAVWLKDTESRFLAVNQGFVQLQGGCNADELIGKNDFDIWPAELAEGYRADDRTVLASGKKKNVEEEIVDADGTRKWFETYKAPIFDAAGSVMGTVGFARDITARNEADAKLQAFSRDFEAFLDQTTDFVYFKDLDSRIRFCSQTLADITGHRSWRDMVGKHDREIFPPDTAKIYEDEEALVFSEGKPMLDKVNPYYNEQGGTGYVQTNKWPLFDADGRLVGIFGISRNITERKLAEEALKKSERFLNATIDSLTAHIAVLDDQGGIILTNKAYRDFAAQNGIEPRTVSEGANYLAVCDTASGINAEEATPFAEGIRDVLSGKRRSFKLEYPCHSPSEDRWFIARVTPFDDEGPRQVIVAHENITERKRVEEALRESEDRLRHLVHHLHSGVVVHAPDTQIIIANKQAATILGISIDQMKGKTAIDPAWRFVREDESILPLEEYPVQRVFAERQPISDRVIGIDRPTTKDRVWVIANAFPEFDAQGRLRQAVVTFFDITARKQAEEMREKLQAQITRTEKAESLGRMAGSIAHIFNNQLGVVVGNLEMAIEDLLEGAKPVTKLTSAMQGARKAAEVGGMMLTYLGQTTSVHVPLDLAESCRQSLPMLQAETSYGPFLKLSLPSPGPTVKGNTSQIQQMLTNLVTNAREGIGEKQGTVTLTVKTVPHTDISEVHRYPTDWQAENATYACLEVTDTGCGIASEAIDKIFDPFYSTKFTGRGLGLAVVSGIVRAHGGVITVASEKPGSTTFRVFLPLSAEEIPRQPGKTAQPHARTGSGTVLLIEDEEMIRDMAKTMITRLGYAVLAAKDGVEAMEMFARHQDEICCVVSDVTMPRMDGWQTLAALRKLSPGIPVILSSGYGEAQVLIGDHPERPQAFLHKPYRKMELQAALAKAMTGLGYY